VKLVSKLRTKHFKFLKTIVKMLRRYRYVPVYVMASKLGIKSYFVRKEAQYLKEHGLIEIRTKDYEGYGITTLGLDVLALNALSEIVDVEKIGHRYDVGKEADIYLCYSKLGDPYIIKAYRIGRTSFKKIRVARPEYSVSTGGWIRLNIKAAHREYDILEKLWMGGVSVPKPLMRAYHMILMEYVPGEELHKIILENPLEIFESIIKEVLKAYYNAGIVHADLSEYNVLVNKKSGEIWIIDWPQWIDVEHGEAEEYLEKDIEQILRFFNKKYRL